MSGPCVGLLSVPGGELLSSGGCELSVGPVGELFAAVVVSCVAFGWIVSSGLLLSFGVDAVDDSMRTSRTSAGRGAVLFSVYSVELSFAYATVAFPMFFRASLSNSETETLSIDDSILRVIE